MITWKEIARSASTKAPCDDESELRKLEVKRGGGARALVERVEVELLVGRVHPIIREAEADENRIDAEGAFEQCADRNSATFADQNGGDAEARLDGSLR